MPEAEMETHRGAFGEYGGDESYGFIDRTFVERILLVGVATKGTTFKEVLNSLKELARLVRTAGANPIEQVLVKREKIHPATYLGKGKVIELKEMCERLDIDTVVFDHELTPGQQVNLEKLLGRTAIDRTTVILDIFAQNASSLEGKVQVELAQLKHQTARLRRTLHSYSQQAGGIGTRGPGETKLETDRRNILRRVNHLEKLLKSISTRRTNQARRRKISRTSQVTIVGYTNTGKSTLLNALTGANILSQNRLFSTLDATTRKLELSGGRPCLITDTVGFITKLPHTLVEAFASTLSGIAESDLVLHILDAAAPDVENQMAEVRNVLAGINAQDIAELLVFNKIDKIKDQSKLAGLKSKFPQSLFISAETGEGIEDLLEAVAKCLTTNSKDFSSGTFLIPFAKGEVMADIHRTARILNSKTTEGGMLYEAEIASDQLNRFLRYEIPPKSHTRTPK